MAENATNTTRQPQSSSSMADEIDLQRLWGLLVDHCWLIIGTTLIALSLGVVYGLLATPIYKADALLQVEDKQGGVPGFSELNELFTEESSADAEIQIIRSRMVLGEIIDQLQLDIKVAPDRFPFFGSIGAPDPVPEFVPKPLFAGYRDSETFVTIEAFQVPEDLEGEAFTLIEENGQPALYLDDQKVGSAPLGTSITSEDKRITLELGEWEYGDEPLELVHQTRADAVNQLRGRLSVSEQGKATGIIALSITGPNKARIRVILDAIGETYLLQNIKRMSAEAENSLDFLDEQLPEIKEKLTGAEEKLNAYRLKSESVDLSLETQSVLERLVAIEAKINELKIKESEVSARFTREHPAYRTLIQQRGSLIQEKDELNKQIKELPETQQEVLRLMRDVEVNQEIYVGLLNKVQELRIMKAGTVGSVRIIDKALVQPEPVKPKKALITILAAMLGAMGSVGVVLIRAAFNRGIESPEQLEEQGISVYASIPLSQHQQKVDRLEALKRRRKRKKDKEPIPLLTLSDPNDLAVEALRSLRTSLHFAMMEASNKVLMVSGPSPGVGKSFVSANLAAVLAQTGQKVVVVDADMRKGHMHRFFDNRNDEGLSDYLSGQKEQEAVIQATKMENLAFIPRGQVPPNPSELLMHNRFKTLMESLSEQYDIVLVDTPPILAVTDAAIVGQLAGSSLIVTRFGVNSVKEVDITLTRFAQNNVEIKGAILNCMERRASNEYGYYAYEYGKSSS
ncbi:polysaccharide biosynthesis tyrosine autokinase [Alcanivorax sp.]|uniref:polysaccharide biosynthesis tyrosine autokinase n=1 Tax=Alcanivorax sp. TaxID=1872427 RepID=UPI0025BD2158|nr:polysaccharide biosynthesis tyrosine autokinase [Alcanivorax sp.]|tara:strand:+ start:1335 stop:3554 length:2220 start_codon:yes stop_codon:yes gene_type:complete